MKTTSLKQLLEVLIDRSKFLGTYKTDVREAQELLEYNEYGLCFDTLITQMYEYDINIDRDFYSLICEIGSKLEIEEKEYNFMKELIKS